MRYFNTIFFLFIYLISHSQKLEVYGGLNYIQFFDIKNDVPYNNSLYDSSPSFSLGIGMDKLPLTDLPFRLTLGFDSYQGFAQARSGGLGGGRRTSVELRKSLISMGIYHPNEKIYKNLCMNVGLVISALISETFNGTTTTAAGNIPTTIDLKQDREKFNSSLYLGFQARIKYYFQLKNEMNIFPYYAFYFGVSNEFITFPKSTKSMRHHLGLGINFSLNRIADTF